MRDEYLRPDGDHDGAESRSADRAGLVAGRALVPRRSALFMAVAAPLALSAASATLAPGAEAAEGSGDRIHVMAFHGADAIILESNGRFAFVDSGEDLDYPDGSELRYPSRPGFNKNLRYEEDLCPTWTRSASTPRTSSSTWAPTPTLTTSAPPTTSSGSSSPSGSTPPSTPTTGSATKTACGTTSTSTTR